MMIYHVPSNQWFVYGVGELGQFGWGGADCIPVPGDWNGDGKMEIGIVYHAEERMDLEGMRRGMRISSGSMDGGDWRVSRFPGITMGTA